MPSISKVFCVPHFVRVRRRAAVPCARIQWSPTKSGANLMIRRRRRDGVEGGAADPDGRRHDLCGKSIKPQEVGRKSGRI